MARSRPSSETAPPCWRSCPLLPGWPPALPRLRTPLARRTMAIARPRQLGNVGGHSSWFFSRTTDQRTATPQLTPPDRVPTRTQKGNSGIPSLTTIPITTRAGAPASLISHSIREAPMNVLDRGMLAKASVFLVPSLFLFGSACGSSSTDGRGDDVGQAIVALTQAPADVTCVRVTAAG